MAAAMRCLCVWLFITLRSCVAMMSDAERQSAFIGYTEQPVIEPQQTICIDADNKAEQCEGWALMGECTNNPAFMKSECCHSCALLKHAEEEREILARKHRGEDKKWQKEYEERLSTNSSEPILVSKSPCVFLLPNFISDEEIDQALREAEPRLHSQAFGYLKEEARTSSGATFVSGWASPILERANTMIGTHGSDGLEVKRYRKDEYYWSHHDYFTTPEKPLYRERVATFLIYLKPAHKGGETMFPWRD